MPTPIKRPRLRGRRTWSGEVVAIDEWDRAELKLEAGCWERAIDKAGNVLADTRDERRRLFAEIGDRLVLSSPALGPMDEAAVAAVEVIEASNGSRMRVRFVTGAIRVGPVHVLVGRKAKPARSIWKRSRTMEAA